MTKHTIYLLLLFVLFAGCRKTNQQISVAKEDKAAKQLLQGIWLNSDDGEPVFKIQGDTVYYPDSISQPAYFKVVEDTILVEGAQIAKYPILRQAEHVIEIKNPGGEQLRLVKSEDKEDVNYFGNDEIVALNQRQLIKRDTVIVNSNNRYHCYVQVNPTTYKVVKSNYNDDGLVVDNIYYDNIIHLTVFNGAKRLYTHDFRKQDFVKLVPNDFLRQCILSDILFVESDNEGMHFQAMLGIPDTPSSFVIRITVDYQGRMSQKVV
ncbi:MAG: DUF4738 domain-containing protein [Prevotella sp.]|nr:DUF4738 domain-containing protein [Prevotella sp.]MBR1461893.1 DUF4738 domain-containing protein [Prevotella sp.]